MNDYLYTILWKNGSATGMVVSGDTTEPAILKAVQCCKDAPPNLKPLAISVCRCGYNIASLVYHDSGNPSDPKWLVGQVQIGGVHFSEIEL